MKVLIAVPSKNRVDVLMKNTFRWLKLLDIDYMIFVEPQDINLYINAGIELDHLYNLGENNKGLGFSKKTIEAYAKNFGYDLIFKIDDDISGWTDYRTKLEPVESAMRFKSIILECQHLFELSKDIVVVSFPYAFQMFEQMQFSKTKRVQTAYIARSEYFHSDTRISVFEDFAVGLNAIMNGKLVMKYGMSGICMGVKVGGGEGGHQSYNREQQAFSEIDVLREIYPPLKFRKVDKVWQYEPDLKSVKFGYYK